MRPHPDLMVKTVSLTLPSSVKSLVDLDAEYVSGISTIIYNRTDVNVVAFYHPTLVQFSKGAYATYTTSDNAQLTFTPTMVYVNSFGYEATWGKFARSDSKLLLRSFGPDEANFSGNGGNGICIGFCF